MRLWIRNHQEEGRLRDLHRTGRRPLVDAAQRAHLVQQYEENGFQPITHHARELDVSVWTVRRVLHSEGIHHRLPARKVALTDAHKRGRLQFARDYLDFNWENVIFSDEKCFRSSQQGRLQLWRRNGTRYAENHVVPTNRSGRISTNLWGWMSNFGPGELTVVPGRATAAGYLEVLNDVMLPTVRAIYPANELPVINFVDDNCPIHRAAIVQDYLLQHPEIHRIPWPARSPDLNPIEHLWALMIQRWDHRNERGHEELVAHCLQIWGQMRATDFCASLVASMRQRLQAVIDAEGGYTRF